MLRLRAAEADAARRDLAAALRSHDSAARHLAGARGALAAEAREAPGDPAHPLAGAYASWLPSAQAAIQRAAAEQTARAAALELSRAALAEARIALRACESLAEAQRLARREVALKREQDVLEDAVRGRT